MPFPRGRSRSRTRKNHRGRLARSCSDSGSRGSSVGSRERGGGGGELRAPVLVYHESARIIVFRDQLRRAVHKKKKNEKEEKNAKKKKNDDDDSKPKEISIQEKLEQDDAEEEFLAPLPPSSQSKNRYERGRTSETRMTPYYEGDDEFLAPLPPSSRNSDFRANMGKVDEILDSTELTFAATDGVDDKPRMEPLPNLQFGPEDNFPLLVDGGTNNASDMTTAESHVVDLFQRQHCAVKTIKNAEWGSFLERFRTPQQKHRKMAAQHCDIAPDRDHEFNSFLTSTSLLPVGGKKMRCFGSTTQYTVGVVFELPAFDDSVVEEEAAVKKTKTWAWPSGYSAKTEFNIDNRGKLINGREEALISLATMRQYNNDYTDPTKESYVIGTRTVKAFSQVPYNEVYLRVGGVGRRNQHRAAASSDGQDDSTDNDDDDVLSARRSFERGVGIPIALFVRTATYGDLITLLRTRARLLHTWGEKQISEIPLLYITPDTGVRVLTEAMQKVLWKTAASNLNPFQNSSISWKTTMEHTEEESFQQKVDELLDLDGTIRSLLTPEELAHIAGGFGATDDSVALILKQAMEQDRRVNVKNGGGESHKLQDIVNEGLASAIRSGDYHTSRQLLILYSLVASLQVDDPSVPDDGKEEKKTETLRDGLRRQTERHNVLKCPSSLGRDAQLMKKDLQIVRKSGGALSTIASPPPPPPLDTDRLRSATNSDGLLAVLGAAQVLRAMKDGSAQTRVQEAVQAVEEWVEHGEQSVAFRIASWYDQRAAQDDLEIATERNSSFMAFVSNKAITNRKAFAKQLRDAISMTDFSDHRFLDAIQAMVSRMHAPCLRLELLQYVLGLDNRYSVAHVARSVELATACLDVAASGVST